MQVLEAALLFTYLTRLVGQRRYHNSFIRFAVAAVPDLTTPQQDLREYLQQAPTQNGDTMCSPGRHV
jgi:hypothetical protein